MATAATFSPHSLMQRRQIGSLSGWGAEGGLRVQIDWSGQPPGAVVEIVAAVVVGGWVFERSMVPRDGGEVVGGALRLQGLTCRALIPDPDGLSDAERHACLRDVADASADQVEQALALRAREATGPTTRQEEEASRQLNARAIREALVPILTSPAVGSPTFVGWGRQLAEWRLAAGPLSPRGKTRVQHEVIEDKLDVRARTAARRRLRDGLKALPTEPREVGPPA